MATRETIKRNKKELKKSVDELSQILSQQFSHILSKREYLPSSEEWWSLQIQNERRLGNPIHERAGIALTNRMYQIVQEVEKDLGTNHRFMEERRKVMGKPKNVKEETIVSFENEKIDNHYFTDETGKKRRKALKKLDSKEQLTRWFEHREHQRTYINCYIVRKYTTFGRHFTVLPVMHKIAVAANKFILKGDVFVDFSCGSNEFAPLLNVETYRSFDKFPPEYHTNFVKKNWFEVTVDDLPQPHHPDHLIVGLNPPFGYQNKTAIKFVNHAISFHPRMLILILPDITWRPPGYHALVEDKNLLSGPSYRIPGSSEILSVYNLTVFLILEREDMYRRRKHTASRP